MNAIASTEAALGRRLVEVLRFVQRQSLGVTVHRHVDDRGRVTPYLDLGAPRKGTLVWLHGFSDRFDTFLLTARGLLDDWRILAPSMPGFGEGWVDPAETHTFDAYADWMAAVLADVGPSRFHLVGNSLGGATALGVAARLPRRVVSVVALNAAGVQLEGVRCAQIEIAEGENLFEVRSRADYERMQRRVVAEPLRLPRWLDAHLYDEARRHADWYVRLAEDMAQSEVRHEGEGWTAFVPLRDVEAPTLALWGDRDSLFPVGHGECIAREVKRGELERLEGVGHCAHLERPRRLAQALDRWARAHA